MTRVYITCWVAVALMALLSGCADPAPHRSLDQSKIISVRPAIPEGARKFVEEQNRQHQQIQKKSKVQAAQPAGYTYQEPPPPPKPRSEGSWLDLFNPAKWGNGASNRARPSQPSPAATSRPS
jgi:hypothetical protein